MYSKTQLLALQDLTTALLQKEGDIQGLRKVLRFHEHRYYVLNSPLISDVEYDLLYKQLEKIEKLNPGLITADSPTQRVGSSLNKDFVTVSHMVPMLSLENSYNPQGLADWGHRLNNLLDNQLLHYCVEPKFDGAGISLIYENDLLVRGTTRGDGYAGDDITTNIKQIGSVPLSAKFSEYGIEKIEIRGEVLLSKNSFRQYNDRLAEEGLEPLANPRNAAAGSLRMKDPAAVRQRKLEAILYHVSFIKLNKMGLKQFPILLNTHGGILQLLSEIGFKTPFEEKRIFSDIEGVIKFCLDFELERDKLPYEIDGMVVKVNEIDLQQQAGSTTHHPRWAMAFKFKARQATSKLLKVDFQVGRTGAITPVGKIDPVHIGGVTVTSVSLFNESIIEEKDLHLGDTVIVERAGDVIPYIVKPLLELRPDKIEKIIFPTNCPVCADKLIKPEGEAVWRCVNINCEAQVVERIIHFSSKNAMDIKTFGEANIRKFYAQGLIRDIPSIYTIDFEKIASLEGFKKKSVDNLQNAIESSKKQPLHKLVFGLGIRYVGETTAKILSKNVTNIFDLKDFSLDQLQQLKDIGLKVAESVFNFFHNEDNLQMLANLKEFGLNLTGEEKKEISGKFTGSTFLFTGTLPSLKRNDAEKLAEEQGGRLLSSVSAHLNYLVAGESAGSKLDKAKKIKSIKIINEEEFLNMIHS